MYIKSLELKNYRNYNNLNLSLDKEINILYGDNAQGKTNILESMFLCSTTKSHKGSKDKEIIQFGKDESHIRIIINRDNIDHKIDMHLRKNKSKIVHVDGIPIKKSSELFGLCNIIFFSPEDLNIIKNGPGERRRFIDMELCQIDKVYMYHLSNYNKILQQRNNLLKQININNSLIETLYIWDEQLVKYGSFIISRRIEFINLLNDIIKKIHYKLTGKKEKIKLLYDSNVLPNEYLSQLKKKRKIDIKNNVTSVGPHRDDICFNSNNIDIRKFGSQGQQRTAALSLKLAEINIVEKIINEKPILLLDDVLSELDSSRQNYLLENIKNVQTIITCTGLDEFINGRLKINKIFNVNNAIVKEVDNEL